MLALLCQTEAFFSFPESYQPLQKTQRFNQIHKEDYEQSWKWMQEFWFQVLYLCLITHWCESIFRKVNCMHHRLSQLGGEVLGAHLQT